MAPSTFYISQGATAPAITATLIDQYGNIANLTGASVKFVMTNAFYGNAVNATATIVNATAGQVSYSWGTTDTVNTGLFSCQWQVIFSSGAQETYPQGYYNQVSIAPSLTSGFPDIIQPTAIFNTIWNSTSAPTAIQGNNGDFWYNTATGFFYGPKAMGAWPAGNLISPATIPLNQFAAPTGNVTMAGFNLTNVNQLEMVEPTSGSQAIETMVTGDVNSRWQLLSSGAMDWGPGNASTDTNLYRASAGLLQTDDNLQVGETLTVEGTTTVNAQVAVNRTIDSSAVNASYTTTSNVTNAAFAYTAVANTGRFLSSTVTGDTVGRFVVDVNGSLFWGPGNAARDAQLSRTGAGTLTFSANVVTNGIHYFSMGTATAGSAPVLTSIGSVSGTAKQLTDLTRDYVVYLEVTTSGTATSISLGHTSAASDVTILSSVAVTAGSLYSFRLPAGWYFKWTGTTTAIGNQNAVGC